MYIKEPTVIPPGVKITRCPPATGKGRSLRSLYREAERKAEESAEGEKRALRYKEARAAGYSVLEAIKIANSD